MKQINRSGILLCAAIACYIIFLSFGCAKKADNTNGTSAVSADTPNARLIAEGKQTFRYDTFGDESFWGDALQLHNAIQGSAHSGVGDGVNPKTALSVGLKVDMDALPAALVAEIKAGKVNMEDVATTLALLKLNAIVGVTGIFNGSGNLKSMGVQCALCHSTVDDAFAPGIGHRLDGWANRDLNVGAIIALAPNLQPFADLLKTDIATVKKVFNSWGPGRYDAELNLDGKAFRPDGKTGATLLPAAFGLVGVNLHTYTGWGTVTYWNAYVANLEMGIIYNVIHDSGSQLRAVKAEKDYRLC